MKRISKLGLLMLAPAFAGCATFASPTGSPAGSTDDFAQAAPPTAKTAAAPAAKSKAAKAGQSAFNAAALSGDLDGALLAAQVQRKAGQLTEAAKALSQLVLVAPDDPRVIGEYGKTLTALGRSDDALAFLDRAIQLKANDWTFYSAQGIALDQKSQYAAAQASYALALALQPGEPTVLNNNALSLMQAGDLAGAERLLSQAKPGTPEYPRLAQNLALVQSLRAAQMPAAVAPAPQPEPVAVVESAPVNVPEDAAAVAADIDSQPASEQSSLPLFASSSEAGGAPNSDAPVSTVQLESPQIVAQADAQPASPADGALVIETIDTVPDENEPHLPTSELILMPHTDEPVPVTSLKPVTSVQVAAAPAAAAKRPATTVTKPVAQPATPTQTAAAQPEVTLAKIPLVLANPTVAAQAAATTTPADVARMNVDKSATNVAATPRSYYLQAGAFASEARAGQTATTLNRLGARVVPATSGGKPIFRVRIGPFLNVEQANTARSEAQALGHSDLQIITQ